MTPLENILSRLDGVQQHEDYFMAKCPAHKDRIRSLTVRQGRDGCALIKCHASCEKPAILAALNLTMKDLFPDSRPTREAPSRIVATYDYTDEIGMLLYQVVRYDPKEFRQRCPSDGNGVVTGRSGWSYKLDGVRRVLYRLQGVLAAIEAGKAVYVVEGEKDAEKLISRGLCATCNAGGAGKWLPDYTKSLTGAHVVILPDNDTPGRDHARLVSREVYPVAKTVRIVELRDLPPKGDISDWLEKPSNSAGLLKQIAQAVTPLKQPLAGEVNKTLRLRLREAAERAIELSRDDWMQDEEVIKQTRREFARAFSPQPNPP